MNRDWVFDSPFDCKRVKGPVRIQYYFVDIVGVVGIADIEVAVGDCDYTKQDWSECIVGRARACINLPRRDIWTSEILSKLFQ